MLDFETIIQIFFIVFAAMALFAGVWTIADNFDIWNDFFKIFKDKGYSYLSFVFRKGKHLRFIPIFLQTCVMPVWGRTPSIWKQKKIRIQRKRSRGKQSGW